MSISTIDSRAPVTLPPANVAAGGTDTALVAAVTGRRIRVVAAALAPGGTATDVTFTSKPAGAGVACSSLFALGVRVPLVLPPNPSGWFETSVGEGLSVTTGAGATTGVLLTYVLV